MIAHGLIDLGEWLTYPSVLCLCLAVLLRFPSSLRSAHQRGLWLAVTTAAAAMVLNLPAVTRLVSGLSGADHLFDLMRNMVGVLSAGAVLYFVVVPTGSRRLRSYLCLSVGMMIGVLLLLDFSAAPHREHGISTTSGPTPSPAYWLTLIANHVVANTVCVIVCCWHGRRTANRSLTTALWLFGAGTALAALYWLGLLLQLAFGMSWAMPFLPLLMNLHALFRAAAVLVPTISTTRGALADIMTVWRLWPLWQELVGAVPHVTLTKRRTRILEVLWPPIPHELLAYRKVIEIHDAMLELKHYVPPEVHMLARDHVHASGVMCSRADTAVLACLVKEARNAKLAGRSRRQRGTGLFTPTASPPPIFERAGHSSTLTDEKRLLVELAQAYESEPVRSFLKRADHPSM